MIKANDKNIKQIVEKEIARLSIYADLNHIDVSAVTDMSNLFHDSRFVGNISKWDTSSLLDDEENLALISVIKQQKLLSTRETWREYHEKR